MSSYALICVALSFGSAAAQDSPTRPVKVVVPNGPGGVSDTLARLTSTRLAKMFGQPFVIDNRGGAGGIIGTEFAARSPNDGYTLYFGGGAQFTVNPLTKKLTFDPLKDPTPISMVSINGMALVVHPDLPVRSVREFIDYVKANPGKVNYGVAGLGQSSHLSPAAFAARAGLDMVVVPYQSTPPALMGLLSGTVRYSSAMFPTSWSWCRAARAPARPFNGETCPAIPGHPDGFRNRCGIRDDRVDRLLRADRLSGPIIDRVAKALAAICREPEVVETMANLGIDAVGNTPEEFAAAIQADLPIVRSAVESAGLLRK